MPRDQNAPIERALICVLGLRGIPGVMGGVESHCEELLPRIARSAPHLRFVVLGRKPYIGDRAACFRGVRVVPLPAPRIQGAETLVSSLVAVLYARRIGAAAVHIHALASGLVAPLARLLGMRVILTIHGADYHRAKWGLVARKLLRWGERIGIRNADAVICVAPSLTKLLQARYPKRAGTIGFIPNGAPALTCGGEQRAVLGRLGIEPGKFVLAVGRLEPGKGFELLIDAFQKSGTGGRLVIVGGANHRSGYASQLVRSNDERVIFAGAQPREVLAHLYRTASLFVLPSLHEGLPICALEAGSMGCPLLLSDIPGNRDLGLPDTHYFRSGDREMLTRALRKPAARYAVSPSMFSSFDWEQISTRTLAVYEAVIGKSAMPRHHAAT